MCDLQVLGNQPVEVSLDSKVVQVRSLLLLCRPRGTHAPRPSVGFTGVERPRVGFTGVERPRVGLTGVERPRGGLTAVERPRVTGAPLRRIQRRRTRGDRRVMFWVLGPLTRR